MSNRQLAVLCASIIFACSGFKYADKILGNERESFLSYVRVIERVLGDK